MNDDELSNILKRLTATETERHDIEEERHDIEEERLSVTYQILAVVTERREIERRLEQIASLHLQVLQDALEEIVGISRETKELIALLLISSDQDDVQRENLKTLIFTPGSRREEIERLIGLRRRLLVKLQEQAALMGLHTPPHIALEIETTERQIEELQQNLGKK